MEDTEYLPTCGFFPIGSRRNEMKGKFLTKNIELKAVCIGSHCVHTQPVTIEDLWTEPQTDDDRLGENSARCPECGSLMILDDEFIVKN